MSPFLQQFVSAPKSMWRGYSSDVVRSAHTPEDPFSQQPTVGGQNQKLPGLGESQPGVFTLRDHFK